jgi:hypothetical protein
MRTFVLVVACVLALFVSRAHADFYRWIDRDGREFYSNDREKIPQEYRNSAILVKPDESRVSVGTGTAGLGKRSVTVAEHKDKYGHGEAYWKKRASALRSKLWNLQEDQSIAAKALDDEQKSGVMNAKKKKSVAKLEKKKAKIEKDLSRTKRKLEVDLPEEARKADAYPGWLRE